MCLVMKSARVFAWIRQYGVYVSFHLDLPIMLMRVACSTLSITWPAISGLAVKSRDSSLRNI